MRFRTWRAMLLSVALFSPACGRVGNPELEVETFHLQHRTGWEAAELVDPYVFRDREENPGAMSATEGALTVRETPDNLAKIRRMLEEFDQPLPRARLRFQLIEADSFQDEDPSIAAVVAQLRDLFRFEGYRLVGEAVVAVGGEEGAFEQPFLEVGEGLGAASQVRGVAEFRGRGTVRLQGIELWIEGAPALETSVTAPMGQTLVMGGSKTRRSGRTLILTVRAEEE